MDFFEKHIDTLAIIIIIAAVYFNLNAKIESLKDSAMQTGVKLSNIKTVLMMQKAGHGETGGEVNN